MGWRTIAMLGVAFTACTRTTPPQGEVLVIVDTDAPIPAFVSRFRLDLYTLDGTWYESREVARPDDGDWPVSFGLVVPDGAPERTALVRLRAFPEGGTRDYRGERFTPRSAGQSPGDSAVPPPPPDDVPRLVKDGVDVTPPTEPEPFVTIDRLIRVKLTPGVQRKTTIILHGACFGTMSNRTHGLTCENGDADLRAVVDSTLEDGVVVPEAIRRTFGGTVPCPPSALPRAGDPALFDAELCVPGGSYVFGNPALFAEGPYSALPLHVVSVSPFLIDKYEVTVGRWRDAVGRGFKPPAQPVPNALPLQHDICAVTPAWSTRWCTFTQAPGVPADREAYPLTCVTWAAAQAFCRFEGGDLPTEAQWEHVAQVAGGSPGVKRSFPWSDPRGAACSVGTGTMNHHIVIQALGACSQTYDSSDSCVKTMCAACNGTPTPDASQGPQRADAAATENVGDVGFGGIVNLAGGASEMMRDAFHGLDAGCWAAAPMLDPVCVDDAATVHSVRGGSWELFRFVTQSGHRWSDAAARDFSGPELGFRCVRPAVP